MGTDDLPERELYQGLIKLAAAFVHGVRGNPRDRQEPEGAKDRLAAVRGRHDGGLDLGDLLAGSTRSLAWPQTPMRFGRPAEDQEDEPISQPPGTIPAVDETAAADG